MDFQIYRTGTLGGNWPAQFSVVRNGEVFLRIVGEDKIYRLMTATAGDDSTRYPACREAQRVIFTAGLLASAYGHRVKLMTDRKGRTYAAPFELHQNDQSDEKFTNDVMDIIRKFFEIYDAVSSTSTAS